MFIGHIAVGLAAKKISPKPSLGTYLMAVAFVDLLWPLFLLLGLEHVIIQPGNTAVTPLSFIDYPLTHSLLMGIVWATLFAGVYWLLRKDKSGAIWLAIAVLSHWVLDAISHKPDMPLYPGNSPLVGLGLWDSLPATMIIESIMYFTGVAAYVSATKAKDKTGSISFWALIIFLSVMYVANLFGPPPPDEKSLAWFALSAWLLPAWGYWIDRHRESLA